MTFNMTVLWLILFIVMVIIEALTQGLTTIWFAAGALVALIISIFIPNVLIQTVAFVVVSVVLLVFTRPLLAGYFNRKVTPTNVDSLLGKKGMVTEDICNSEEKGTVKLDGLEWMARSAAGDSIVIPKGSEVVVQRVEGVKLMVTIMES